MDKNKIVVTCPKGLTPFLRGEILDLSLPVLGESVAGITTEGGMNDAMRLNFHLRTGHRVLLLLREFYASSPEDLYRETASIRWEDYIDDNGYISVTSSVSTPSIKDTRYANVKCKDAIVDRLLAVCGRRPDSGPDRDRTVIYLYWKDSRCAIYLDTSGEPLSKRGYRKLPFRAPMQETLAAAVVMATGWSGEGSFINPMCGSGTLAIEAALIALNRPPGLLRSNFGFMHIKGYNKAEWDGIRASAKARPSGKLAGRIIATDINPEAIEAAGKNADTAGVKQYLEFGTSDFSETVVPEGGGVVVLNPGYGERMGDIDTLASVYGGIGDFFKKKCKGYRGFIFTGNPELAKKVGLRAKKRTVFFNGEIECRLLEYELYEGSRDPRGPRPDQAKSD
ncbi:MAG: class I SAM-dependent RNA methyltransferase [Nitrospirae bacterium]|nr:class I SAM-dependent RNA methyltransferase [Nitrospirota bacterium]